MNLLSGLVNGINTNDLLGQKLASPNAIDMDDKTFSDLLEKEMNVKNEVNVTNPLGSLGMPAGLQIQPLDIADLINTARETKQAIQSGELHNGSDLLNFAKRQATNLYQHSGAVVTGLTDFIEDALNL